VSAKLSQLMATMTELLETHMRALTDNDASSRAARGQLRIATALDAIAKEMTGYRDLPMAPHDLHAMTDGRQLASFERFVHEKQELLALLQGTAEKDAQRLAAMRSTSQDV